MLALGLEIELALALDIECYCITASVIWLAPANTSSVRASASTSTRDRASVSTRHRALPYHHISQSFDLPTATTSSVRASTSASTRDRASTSARQSIAISLHQPVIWLASYHHISQSFDLPTATTSSELALALVLEIGVVLALDIECYHITASVNHLTCPLPPYQSVIWFAHCHHTIQYFDLPSTTALLHHHITTSISLVTCPLQTHQSVIWLSHCHHIHQSFDLPSTTALPLRSAIWLVPTTTSVNHLTCPLPPHHYVPTTPSTSSSSSSRTSSSSSTSTSASPSTSSSASSSPSTSARELEIIKKFYVPTTSKCKQFKIFFYHLVVVECPHHLTRHHHWSCIHFWAKKWFLGPHHLPKFWGKKPSGNH